MKLFRVLLLGLCLAGVPALVSGCGSKEEEAVIPPPPPDNEDPNKEDPNKPEDPPSDADQERLARLGQTPLIVAYFTEYTPSSVFPTLEDVKCFTHINVGHARFVNPKTGDGGLEIKSPGPDYLRRIVAYKSSYPELKVLLFIGGWGKNADGFSEMAKDDTKRALFCSECVRICNEYGLDGVDLDWEYPTYAAKTTQSDGSIYYNGADPADRANFTTLVKDLREALGKDKLISYAAASDDYDGKYMDAKAVLEWVDYINVMTYSMGDPNPSDPSKQRHNSPLYTSSRFANSKGGADCIERYHDRQGVPYDRMNYGIGFYGHGDGNVYPSSVSYAEAREAQEKGTVNGKSVAGYNKRWWDEPSKSCYLGDAAGVMYASYEDVESIGYRVEYLKSKGMLGCLVWEYREDDDEGTLRKALRQLMNGSTPDNPGTNPGDNPGTGTGEGPDAASCKDLGSSETANCYVVTSAGNYKFKTVKGNSTTSVGTVASAEVLWETASGMIDKIGVSGNYITFATASSFKSGNALVAAKDASGKILWSWHIWMPKTAPGGDLYGLSWYTMMSRNLGALEDASASAGPDSYGLLYQWGRKDPFPCETPATKVAGTLSLAESIANPTTFAYNSGTWMASVDASAWGDKTTKTIYDPCPPGYKVPMREDVTALFSTDALSGTEGWQYASGKAFAIGNPKVWFPYTGYIDATGYYVSAGSETKIWNSHMDSANNQGYGIFVNGESSTRSSQKAAQGGTVRCISLNQAEFTNEAGMPVMGSYKRIVFETSQVVELSGLHLSKDKDFLWGVGDEGYLYKFTNIDGDVSAITPSTQWTHDADMEGVTMDPATGDLYLAIEPRKVYYIAAPTYNTYKTVIEVEEAANMGNSGMEGIAWHKGDLYLGAQSGATLWKYSKSGTTWSKVWKKQLGQIAPGITEVGDLFYDETTDLLWVSDSEAFKLFVFDGDVTKLKAIYDIKFIGNPESVCVDHARNCVWMADDGSTSKIYKISFTGL